MKIAIIGAGAAGCFAAANIPYVPGREVTIYEKTGKSLQKVKVSGGGRCNVTHACFDVPELLGKYPRGKQLLKKTLYEFGPAATVDWFESRGVQLKAEADGRMFPVTDQSQTIIDCLLKELDRNRVKMVFHQSVERIEKKENQWLMHFADKSTATADKVLIACGGFPKSEQYHWIQALGHHIEEPVPSLFTFNLPAGKAGMPQHPITELMGVVVEEVTVKVAGTKMVEKGPLLITHWGLSGPVVLRTSAWAARELHQKNYSFSILINWLGKISETLLREKISVIRKDKGKQWVSQKNPFDLPKRFWGYILWKNGINENTKWGDLPASQQNKLIESLINDRYEINGKTTFKEEFVTCGGIQLSEINPTTMESRIAPGIYFAGEILNADGITGGFNFQHAWASGWIAAKEMMKSS